MTTKDALLLVLKAAKHGNYEFHEHTGRHTTKDVELAMACQKITAIYENAFADDGELAVHKQATGQIVLEHTIDAVGNLRLTKVERPWIKTVVKKDVGGGWTEEKISTPHNGVLVEFKIDEDAEKVFKGRFLKDEINQGEFWDRDKGVNLPLHFVSVWRLVDEEKEFPDLDADELNRLACEVDHDFKNEPEGLERVRWNSRCVGALLRKINLLESKG